MTDKLPDDVRAKVRECAKDVLPGAVYFDEEQVFERITALVAPIVAERDKWRKSSDDYERYVTMANATNKRRRKDQERLEAELAEAKRQAKAHLNPTGSFSDGDYSKSLKPIDDAELKRVSQEAFRKIQDHDPLDGPIWPLIADALRSACLRVRRPSREEWGKVIDDWNTSVGTTVRERMALRDAIESKLDECGAVRLPTEAELEGVIVESLRETKASVGPTDIWPLRDSLLALLNGEAGRHARMTALRDELRRIVNAVNPPVAGLDWGPGGGRKAGWTACKQAILAALDDGEGS